MPMACNSLKPVVTNDIDASDGFNTSNKPEEGTVHEPDANKDGEELNSDELEDEDDGSETVDDFRGAAFDIGCTVNLESGDLALRKTHQCSL